MAELTSLNSNPAITDRSRKQTGCKLLSLPSELQTAIWELVLFANGTVVDIRKTYQAPQLLHTCQQVSDEAGSLYYGTATFSVKAERGSDTNFEHRSPSGLCILWLTTRAFGASKHVRRVRLDLYNSAGTSSGALYPTCTNISTILMAYRLDGCLEADRVTDVA